MGKISLFPLLGPHSDSNSQEYRISFFYSQEYRPILFITGVIIPCLDGGEPRLTVILIKTGHNQHKAHERHHHHHHRHHRHPYNCYRQDHDQCDSH